MRIELGASVHPTRIHEIWRQLTRDSGYVTAELALGLPAVLLVTYMCMWGISVAALDLRLHAVTANTARVLARGDSLNSTYLSQLPTGTTLTTSKALDRLTVTLTTNAPSLIGPLRFPQMSLTSSTVVRDETYVGP